MNQLLPRTEPSYRPPQPSEQITVAVATTKKEREKIYRFRYQVYVEEMGKLLSGDVNHRHRLLCDESDDWGLLFYAVADREIVGTMRLNIGYASDFTDELRECFAMDEFQRFSSPEFPDHKLSVTNKSMVAPHYRRSQAFYLLGSNVYETFHRQGCQFNFTGGAPYMVALYEQLGHRRYKSNFPVPGYGYMVPMVLMTQDIGHLRQVRSPLWRVARKLENSPAASEWFAREFAGASRFINRQLIGKEDIWQLLVGKLGRPLDRAVTLFRGMSEAEALICADAAHIVLCEAGDVIVHPTDMCNDIFVIMSGVVSVRRQLTDRRSSVAILRPGQVYGEKTFIARARQNATVIAQTDTELLVLPRHALERLELQHPAVAAKLLHNIGARTARKYA